MIQSSGEKDKGRNKELHRLNNLKQKEATTEVKPLEERQRKRSKIFSILDGSLFSVSVGLTGNFISAFGVALGVSNFMIGMLATVPHLIAAIIQLSVQSVRSMFRNRKAHIVFFATLQALMWLPLIFAPQLHAPGPWLLLFITLNAVFGMLINPVWNSFVTDIVLEDERGSFFGLRNMFTGLTAFLGTIAAGWILNSIPPTHPFLGFTILFVLACVFRLMSAYFLSKMDDPSEDGLSYDTPDVVGFLRKAHHTPLGQFTIFLMLFNISVYIASPFFAVYQLSVLKFSYSTFTMIAAASAVSSFVTMLFWGKYVDKVGAKNVLVISGFLIPAVPMLWALTANPLHLVVIEVFSGIVWAGFNLSVSAYVFDATERSQRTKEIAEYTLMVQVAVFFGAMLGSGILGFFPIGSKFSFLFIFVLSAILRLLIMLVFFRSIRELRIIEVPIKGRMFRRFVNIKPHHGVIYEPAVETLQGNTHNMQPKEINETMKNYVNKSKQKKL